MCMRASVTRRVLEALCRKATSVYGFRPALPHTGSVQLKQHTGLQGGGLGTRRGRLLHL